MQGLTKVKKVVKTSKPVWRDPSTILDKAWVCAPLASHLNGAFQKFHVNLSISLEFAQEFHCGLQRAFYLLPSLHQNSLDFN